MTAKAPQKPRGKKPKPPPPPPARGAPKQRLVVAVARDNPSGDLYSEVRRDPRLPGPGQGVVIDRPTRIITEPVLINRAKALAKLLGIPYVEDLDWPCCALQKLKCGCPKCRGMV